MEQEKIKELFKKYESGQCSEEEKALIETWYNNQLKISKNTLAEDIVISDLQSIYQELPHQLPHSRIGFINHWTRIAAVVFLVVSLSVGFYLVQEKQALQEPIIALKIQQNDIAPGLNKTFLTLENGSRISIDSASIGEIATQGGVKITKVKEGLIVYTNVPIKGHIPAFNHNIITTSNGAQCQIILSDGTTVWLNAASSLKYPTAFSRGKRKVELKGEGYFEVAKNKAMPFKVVTKYQEVAVLGTHFNINSYADEPTTKTTLLEGSVKISQLNTPNSLKLKPGEQSTLTPKKDIKIAQVNTDHAIAWKSGLFQFENSDVETVMRQIARWYDMDVEYKGKVPNIKLWGEVHRSSNPLKVLEILSYFNLKYKIANDGETKKIIILNNN